jgi:hypothetical protein
MKRLSSIMSWRYRNAGSIDCYVHERGGTRSESSKSLMRTFEWYQFWFLMRDVLKKEGVFTPRYASTVGGPR